MNDYADIVRDFVTHASEVHSGGDAALAALDALVAERDEWASKAQEHLAGWNAATLRAETAEDEVTRWMKAAADNGAAQDAAEAEVARLREALAAKLETALAGMLDERLRSMPGINPDGSVSTSSMAETLARAELDRGSE
jgi:hypothetical protein